MLLTISDDASVTTEQNILKLRENLFNKTMEGNPITDKAMKILLTA